MASNGRQMMSIQLMQATKGWAPIQGALQCLVLKSAARNAVDSGSVGLIQKTGSNERFQLTAKAFKYNCW